jgi:hypothetical protein
MKIDFMKRIATTFLLCVLFANSRAHEGMWIPSLLDAVYDDMKAYGLQLSKEDLYSVNQSSLKDAIVLFGGGCTAEVVSESGLIFTNHHCGYSYIQYHSSLEHDYLTDGFWAKNAAEELICDQLTATFIVSIEEVTESMNKGIEVGMAPSEIEKVRIGNRKALESAIEKKTGYGAYVRAFNYGNQFFMIRTKTYSDVRLVGAPPSVIGKFGGDTDNWVWPRHTGDFSIFRIYADENNEPSGYKESNKPYRPGHSLPISLDGVKEGDFSMIYGFPGRTEHFLSSWAVDYLVNKSLPIRIEMRETVLGVLETAMRSEDKVRIQYAAKQSSISNAYKKWIGQVQGLQEIDALSLKRKIETEFKNRTVNERAFVNYQDVLPALEALYTKYEKSNLARDGFGEYIYSGPEIFAFAYSFESLLNGYEKLKADGKLTQTISDLKAEVRMFFKDFDLETEKKIFEALTPIYVERFDEAYGPVVLKAELMKKGGKNMLMTRMYDKGFFTDSTRLMNFLNNVNPKSFKKIKADPAFSLAKRMFDIYNTTVKPENLLFNSELEYQMTRFVKAGHNMNLGGDYWFDANSTLRLSFGKVEGSAPRDGMEYTYYTTSDGILEKNRNKHPDFEINPRLSQLFSERNFGVYGENGELHVCYTGSNHTTGGNSGSPALNSKGQLVGINFDRSWESTMSDVVYNPEICRNIMVDVRYVLWVIDVYANADYLLNEMKLIKTSPELIEMK